ncbi:hypothetical protein MKHDV_00912 [Halodesulfovibrio sp. MK-HDV]|nr:hypothetical protein MKHDV_00912 [Halodesulfovibrio sp. MK-HDV]
MLKLTKKVSAAQCKSACNIAVACALTYSGPFLLKRRARLLLRECYSFALTGLFMERWTSFGDGLVISIANVGIHDRVLNPIFDFGQNLFKGY